MSVFSYTYNHIIEVSLNNIPHSSVLMSVFLEQPVINQQDLNSRVEDHLKNKKSLLQVMHEKDQVLSPSISSQQLNNENQKKIKQKTSLSIDLLNSHLRLQNRFSDIVNQKKHKVSYNLLQDPIVVNMQAKSYENTRLESILHETMNLPVATNQQSEIETEGSIKQSQA